MLNVRLLSAIAVFSMVLPAQWSHPRGSALPGSALRNEAGTQTRGVYQDRNATPEQRAADLVSRMTLEEKVSQMQNAAPAIPRLGIPRYDWWNEALHGVARAGLATVFPQAIGLAATWDVDLMHRVADTISTEARAKYNDAQQNKNYERYYGLTFWSPNINIFRDPRWGRGQETYGEDPFLTSQMAIAFIRGLQGNDPKYFKVIATAKHFAVHSGPESSRHQFNVRPSRQDLEETYEPAFRASIMTARADSVMCAYNAVDGLPACGNSMLLQDTLRKNWNFNGYVVSDCGAIYDFVHGHQFSKTMAEAAAAGVHAGTDLSCGEEYASLVEAVHRGLIPESEINSAVERLFVARFRLGMFDPADKVPFSRISLQDLDSEPHRQLALEAARKSIVLLKNDGNFLPLGPAVRRIAVIGPAADDPQTMLGNYYGIPSRIVTPLDGMEAEFPGRIVYSQGSLFTGQTAGLLPRSVLLAPGSNDKHGLRADYFTSDDLSGAPVISRFEPKGFFQWEMHDPEVTHKVSREHFSLRWTAILQVAATGDYGLGFTRLTCADCKGNDSAKLYLDDAIVVEADRHVSWTPRTSLKTIHLEAGRKYVLKVEYRQQEGAAGLELAWQPPAEALLTEAKNAIAQADATVAFVGLNASLEGEESEIHIPGFAGGDRTDLELPAVQKQLLSAAFSLGKPVVVVLLSGSAVSLRQAKTHAAALLETWYGGEYGGTAIAETLSGKNNPAGRLPITFYESEKQLPPFDDYSMANRTYRYFRGAPLYPFGFGLSYSNFIYSNLHIHLDSSAIHISARITNKSRCPGEEVAELYITRQGVPTAPVRELKGLQRIFLKAGESRDVEFRVSTAELSAENAVEGAGSLESLHISIGGGQPLPDWSAGHYVEGDSAP